MTAATRPLLTFEEYVDFCADTDERFELVRGELVKMTPPTWLHIKIAKFLEQSLDAAIKETVHDWEAFRDSGQRTEDNSSRLPDVIVAPSEEIESFLRQTAILQVAAPLVVEIVSPSSVTEDYVKKMQEYEELGVLEYWIVDHEGLGAASYIGFPKRATLTVCILENGRYKKQLFHNGDRIESKTFPSLQLTVRQVFSAGKSL